MSDRSKAETPIVKEIRDALDCVPAVVWIERVQSGKVQVRRGWMQLAREGTADLVGELDNGISLTIEVKCPGEHTTPAQDMRLARSRRAGGCAFVAHSADEALREILAFQRGGVAALSPLPAEIAAAAPAKPKRKRAPPPEISWPGKQERLAL